MCGIYGALSTDPGYRFPEDVLDRMASSLTHRGPDGGGAYLAGPFAMGMRRLSIIDLKGGDQPMSNEDGSIWVVYNGEIYNYRELTRTLLARGHRFATASDTEVLVHLYEEYGERCVDHLRGMFAFAIWDTGPRTLLLGRDRLGIKPLYYAATPYGLVFGSELKALLQSPWVPTSLDRRALVAYLQYGYVPDPWSILEGVVKLPPGHTLVVRDGKPAKPRRYWESTAFFHGPDTGVTEAAAGERLWSHIESAVRSHLVSDVPVGAFLSGGVDSSTVVAVMAREANASIKTFSVGFREDRFNELPHARRVAQWCGTDHHELLVEPEDLGLLDQLLGGFDEPFSDPSSVPTYLVSRLARQHVKVVLSGDGGDELFAGYDRYLVDQRRRRLGLLGDWGLGAGLRLASHLLPVGGGKNTLYTLSLPRLGRYVDSISLFPRRALSGLVDDESGLDPIDLADWADASLDPLSQLQDLDLKTYLPGDILTKVDRMTMACSLEARVPLLDHPLVEFACALPTGLRLRSGQTKYLLKRVLKGRIPDEVLTRAKQGFDVPLESWFSGRLPDFLRDQLGDLRRLKEVGIRPGAVASLMDLFAATKRRDYCERLWALVVLDRSLQRLQRGLS